MSTREDLTLYTLDVYKCEAPSSDITEYELVASGISANAYSYSDTSVSGLANPHREWFYKLEVTNTSTGAKSVTPEPPAYVQDTTAEKTHREILRRKNLALNRYSGRSLKLLKRRS
ncbi:MAG: hypothetical protein H8E12_16955 [Rhodobacteraceae bacterium]|nr:hypothetical protein [Paracoccaceae bacterium]